MPSLEPEPRSRPSARLQPRERRALLEVGRRSIAHGLRSGNPLEVETSAYPPSLREPRATFVTLRFDGNLRGCTGTLEAVRPLVADVAVHAFTTAFSDPRFPPLRPEELARVRIHISILGPPEPLATRSEAELLARLRPGVDGIILEDVGGSRRATFLPAVWDSLPAPQDFVRELKRKAGLSPEFWSEGLRFARYTTEAVSEDEEAEPRAS